MNIIIIDSYDGAENRKTQRDKTNIMFFRSKLLLQDELQFVKVGESFNILTWQQMEGTENAKNLLPLLGETYKKNQQF